MNADTYFNHPGDRFPTIFSAEHLLAPELTEHFDSVQIFLPPFVDRPQLKYHYNNRNVSKTIFFNQMDFLKIRSNAYGIYEVQFQFSDPDLNGFAGDFGEEVLTHKIEVVFFFKKDPRHFENTLLGIEDYKRLRYEHYVTLIPPKSFMRLDPKVVTASFHHVTVENAVKRDPRARRCGRLLHKGVF